MNLSEKLLVTFSIVLSLGNLLLWGSQIRINQHAAAMFEMIGDKLGFTEKT